MFLISQDLVRCKYETVLFLISFFFFLFFSAIKHELSSLSHLNSILERSHCFVDTLGHKSPVQLNLIRLQFQPLILQSTLLHQAWLGAHKICVGGRRACSLSPSLTFLLSPGTCLSSSALDSGRRNGGRRDVSYIRVLHFFVGQPRPPCGRHQMTMLSLLSEQPSAHLA